MTFDHSQLIPVLPEIILLAGASLVLLVDLLSTLARRLVH